ncbi:ABC transporter substrate-binding protein [Pseudalgibacter alginicilyticus]|uniref:ABC transporter substrate-binding protein n=1 Tax=Pseudalgibacter alginicilyticus TaxID=1736674 RepID=A0A0P0CU35_9FLAO|nr:ABC transporter substrate-binding protein [Pseudalgibacter alginicilyticus]ALJ06420.1 ABC transporter substrate-binding protein [Pseudalgibacter alginicilyticus]
MTKTTSYLSYIRTNNLKCIFLFLIIFNCKNKPKELPTEIVHGKTITLKYAKGFSVVDYNTYKIIDIKNPWPNTEKNYRYVLINKENAAKTSFLKNEYDGIITTPIEKVVVTSTTHIPALDLLNVENTLIGFPGIDYISSEKIRQRIDDGKVKELGKNEGLNTEILLELNPDVVVGFGIDGNNRSFEIIKKSGIPVIFNGDWVENSPLAKAEWIKFFGAIFNKEKEADSIFNKIEHNYLMAKKIAKNVKIQPTILSGAMHSDVWYLPNGTSTEAQLFKDANTHYLWKDTEGSGSLKLNFESVFVKAKDADIWLNPSNYSNLEILKNANNQHAMFKAFENKTVYSFTNTTGASGGVIYYELGMTRPDIVLKDLIKICHPELLQDYEPYFFKRLE